MEKDHQSTTRKGMMAVMAQSMSSKIPIILGAVVFLAVMIGGFWFMTRTTSCLDLQEANIDDRVVVFEGTDGNCYYRDING